MTIVIKRNDLEVPFDKNKIVIAIDKAKEACQLENIDLNFCIDNIVNTIKEYDKIDISKIQKIVEDNLMSSGYTELARTYIEYRHDRDNSRDKYESLIKDIEGLVKLKDDSILNENANKDSKLIPTQRDLLAGIVAKHYAKNYILPKDIVKAHDSGDIHFHDLDYSPFFPSFNCMLVDIKGMFEKGFKLGNAEIETPKSIMTATAVVAQIVAQVASNTYGGTTLNRLDETLAPYVTSSYNKHLKDATKYNISNKELYATEKTEKECIDAFQALEYEFNTMFSANGQTPFVTVGFGLGTSWESRLIQKCILKTRLDGLGKNKKTAVFPKLVFSLKDGVNLKDTDKNYDIKLLAIECSSKRIYPDILNFDKIVEATGSFKHPMGCVDGEEVIYYKYKNEIFCESFYNVWTKFSKDYEIKKHGISEYMTIDNFYILDIDGSMTKVTCLIRNPDQSNWRLVKFSNGRSLVCTSDHPLPVIGKGRTFVDDLTIGDKVGQFSKKLNDIISDYKENNLLEIDYFEIEEIINLSDKNDFSYDVTTESDTFCVSGIHSHNCRSFLSKWEDENGNEIHEGRNNLGVVTINIPRIAIESKGDKNLFWKLFDQKLEIAHRALKERIKRLENTKASVAPILYMEGACGVRLNANDNVSEIFKHGRASISLGYIGLHEAIIALFGNDTHIFDSKEKQDFALSIVNKLKEATDKWKEESGYGYSVYSTPSENLCDRFCRLDKEKFGEIKGVTDKKYYTNSFHLDVEKKVDPYSKMLFEEQYPQFASGGFICYGEFPNLRHNPKAIEDIWNFAYKHVPYYGTNFPVDQCFECGFEGEFDCTNKGFSCPQCGNNDPKKVSVIRRVCGYLGSPDARPFNEGKQEEVLRRIKHID